MVIVGIGCDREQALPAEVLKFSICRGAETGMSVKKLDGSTLHDEMPEALKRTQRTAFSFQRFLLARELLGSDAEIAIYLDSDMLVLRPLGQLVALFAESKRHICIVAPLPEWKRRKQSSVMVMDRAGAAALWRSYTEFIVGKITYDQLVYLETLSPVGDLDYEWNCLEYLDERTALIHYTDMDAQPWLREGNPNAGIWYTYLWRLAQDEAGRELIAAEVEAGHIRPSLLEIIHQGPSISSVPVKARLRDLFFVPPHRFRRLKSRKLRRSLAPALRALIALQFMGTNGQPNIR